METAQDFIKRKRKQFKQELDKNKLVVMKQLFNKLKNINETLFVGIVIFIAVIALTFFVSRNDSPVAQVPQVGYQVYYADELGFSFQYPDHLLVDVDPDNPERLIIVPKSFITNENDPMTAIIISTGTGSPNMTVEEWLKSPDSGYDASMGYSNRLVGGQDAVVVGDDWVVLKTPDGKRHISIAFLLDQNNGAIPLYEEFREILDSFSFNIPDMNTSAEIISHINKELCKEGTFTAPLEQEVAYDKEIRKDEFVQYLRKALDGSASGDSFGLSNYSNYIKSKFIVISTDTAPGGGASIVLIFKNRPDKVFYAWIYDYSNGKYDLRDFIEYDLVKNGAPNIEETQKRFSDPPPAGAGGFSQC